MSKNYLYPVQLGEPTGVNPPSGHVYNFHSADGRMHIKKSDGTVLDTLYAGGSNGRILVLSDDELMINSPMSVSGNDVLLDAASDLAINDGGMLLLDDGSVTGASKVQWNSGNFIVHDAAADQMLLMQSDDGVMMRWEDTVGSDDVEVIVQSDGLEVHILNQANAKVNFVDNLTGGGPWVGTLQNPALTADLTWTLPGASGTLALSTDNIYGTNGTLSGNRTMTMAGNTLLLTGGTTIHSLVSGTETITSGTGSNPIGFGSFGDLNALTTTAGDFDHFSGVYRFSGNPVHEIQIYDNTTFVEKAGLVTNVQDFSGTDRPYASLYYADPNGTRFTGIEANAFGTRLLDQNPINRLPAINASDGVAVVSSVGGNGYIGTVDQAGLAAWLGTNDDQSLDGVLSTGNQALGNDMILDPAAAAGDGGFQSSPTFYLRGNYDADPTAGVNSTDVDTTFRNIVTLPSGNLQASFIIDHSGQTAYTIFDDLAGIGEYSHRWSATNPGSDTTTATMKNTGSMKWEWDDAATLDTSFELVLNSATPQISVKEAGVGNTWILQSAGVTGPRTYDLQDASGTIAFLSDITANSIYSSNGSLTGNRTLTGAGNSLVFDGLDGFTVNSTASGIQLVDEDTGASLAELTLAGAGGTILRFNDTDAGGGIQEIQMLGTTYGGFIVTDTSANKGMEYAADYSANYTARSIVDKAYVDGLIAANNELSEVLANGNTTGANNIIVNDNQVITTANGTATDRFEIVFDTSGGLGTDSIAIQRNALTNNTGQLFINDNVASISHRTAAQTLSLEVGTNGTFRFADSTGAPNLRLISGNSGDLTSANLTAARTWTLPDASGTIALTGTHDLQAVLDAGSSATLTSAISIDTDGNNIIMNDSGVITGAWTGLAILDPPVNTTAVALGWVDNTVPATPLIAGFYHQTTGTTLATKEAGINWGGIAGSGTDQHRVAVDSGSVRMVYEDTSGDTRRLSISTAGSIFIDGIDSFGAKYAADYSTAGVLDDRWIPDYGAVKAYADSVVGANNELSEVLTNGNTTGGTDISVTAGDNILMHDNNDSAGATRIQWNSDVWIEYDDAGDGVLNLSGVDVGVFFQTSANDYFAMESDGLFYFEDTVAGFVNNLYFDATTASRNWTLPDASGTIALTSDIENIYNADGTLTGTRTVTTGGNNILLTGGGGIGIGGTPTGASGLHVAGQSYFDGMVDIDNILNMTGTNRIQFAGTGALNISGASSQIRFEANEGFLFRTSAAAGNVQIRTTEDSVNGDNVYLLNDAFRFKEAGSTDTTEFLQIGDGTDTVTIDAVGANIVFNKAFDGTLDTLTLTAARTWNLPDTSGTIALLSDIAANNELSEVLANGNTTGGTDIAVTDGDKITFNGGNAAISFDDNIEDFLFADVSGVDGFFAGTIGTGLDGLKVDSSGIVTLFRDGAIPELNWDSGGASSGQLTHATLTATRTWTLPDATGTLALITDTTLAAVLANGNTTGGTTIDGAGNGVVLEDTIEGSTLTVIDEIIGVSAVGTSFTTGADFTVNSAAAITLDTTTGTGATAAGANIILNAGTAGRFAIPSNADPDTNITTPIDGTISYDTTDDEFRVYVNGAWDGLALQSDITANNEWSEVLANGANSGATNPIIDTGQEIQFTDSANTIGKVGIELTLESDRAVRSIVGTGYNVNPGSGQFEVGIAGTANILMNVVGAEIVWTDTSGGGFNGRIRFNDAPLTANRIWTMPDASGTVALLSDIPTLDGNGIYGGSDTIATSAIATIDTNFTFRQTDSPSALTVDNLTAGNANINLISNATANGNAILSMRADGAAADSYIHFNDGGTNEITVGWDKSANSFRMGTTSVESGIFYEYNKTSGTGRHATSLGIGGTFPGTGSRLAVRGAGTGTNNIILLEDSAGTDRMTVRENGDILIGTNSPGFNAKVTIRGNGNTIGTRALRVDNSSGLTSMMVYDNRAVYSYGGYAAGTSAPDGQFGFYASGGAGHHQGFRAEVNDTGQDVYQFFGRTTTTNTGFDNIGMYLDITGGDNNWAIWTEDGNITFGDTTPTTTRNPKLQIQGNGADAATDNTLWKNSGGSQLMVLNDNGQLVIGTGTAESSAALEIESTTGVLLLSRLTDAQEGLLTGVDGMMHYNSDDEVFKGYRNSNWREFTNKYSETFTAVAGPDTFVVTHNLNTESVTVSVRDTVTGAHVASTVTVTDADTVTITGNGVTGRDYEVTVIG